MTARLTDLHFEILDLVVDDDERTAVTLQTLHNRHLEPVSQEALALDFDGLNAIFEDLQDHGLDQRPEAEGMPRGR